MADAPRSKSEAKRLAIQRERTLSERIRCKGFNVSADQLADEVAALEQERDELVALVGPALAQAKIDADENARLREAIAEIDEAILGPEPTAPRVREILRALTKGENDGKN